MVKDINLDDLKILTEDKESYIKQAGIPEKNLFTADNANEIKNKHNALVEYATGFPTEEQKEEMLEKAISTIKDEIDKQIIIPIENAIKLNGYDTLTYDAYFNTIINGYEDDEYNYFVKNLYHIDKDEKRYIIRHEYLFCGFKDNGSYQYGIEPFNTDTFIYGNYAEEHYTSNTAYKLEGDAFIEHKYEIYTSRDDNNNKTITFKYKFLNSGASDVVGILPNFVKYDRIKK